MSMCKECDAEKSGVPFHEPSPLATYIAYVLPDERTEDVEQILFMAITEIFVRSEKGSFIDGLENFASSMMKAFDEDEHPSEMHSIFKIRDENLAAGEAQEFGKQSQSELTDILNTQGVLDDDEAYGNYL